MVPITISVLIGTNQPHSPGGEVAWNVETVARKWSKENLELLKEQDAA